MLKRLLLTCVLGIYFTSLLAQRPYSDYEMYMYSGRYSNPALSGVKEYGTSLTYQSSFARFDKEYSVYNSLWSHTVEFGQSLFSGKGGLELRWNQSDYYKNVHQNSGMLGYSHGFEISKKLIIRTGLRTRLNSHVFTSTEEWIVTSTVPPGNDLQFSWDGGVSLHMERFYVALGISELTPVLIRQLQGLQFSTFKNVFSVESGGIIPLTAKKEGIWKWSIQPYAKVYLNSGFGRACFGTFVNFGPIQAGLLVSSGNGILPSIGYTSSYLRLTYSYMNSMLDFGGYNHFMGDAYHELALRFILPGKAKVADFMKNVYRGF